MRHLIASLWLCLFSCTTLAQTNQAAIATAHPLATKAGFEILQQGGNAFDAAVAVTAALAVVEPAGSGLGGGGFWLLHRAEDDYQVMIDGREMAPDKAHRDMYLNSDGQFEPDWSLNGPLAAGIPGVPAGLVHLSQKYGVLPLETSLQPAVQYAEQGFAVTEGYQHLAGFRR
ncbi:MAG: gamma-glutamyltransferase, partial [Pseudomonadota bacterium]|nr:gamma-glutamyltransferase [Pseudomonadota bacterium]